MKILVLGSNGMLGKYIYDYLGKTHQVAGTTRKEFDVYKSYQRSTLEKDISVLTQSFDVVINCIGITNKRSNSLSEMYVVNSFFPHILDEVFSGIFIHPTTDCVFSGDKGNYTEHDLSDCIDDYGVSKYLGESLKNACVIRVSIIGESDNDKSSLIEWVKSNPPGSEIKGFTNHYWNGITCLEYAKMIEEMLKTGIWKGIKHIRSNGFVTKEELVRFIIEVYNLDIKVLPHQTVKKCDRTLTGVIREKELFDQIKEMRLFYSKKANSI